MASGPTEYEKKLIEMQYQMRINNEEMKDCFSELENWTKDMNEKEKSLKSNPGIAKISNKVFNRFEISHSHNRILY